MKRLLFLVCIIWSAFVMGCSTMGVQPLPQQLKITVDNGQVEAVESGDAVKPESPEPVEGYVIRWMPDSKSYQYLKVDKPEYEMVLSHFCKILNDTAYITIDSISSYGAKDLWHDFKVLQSMDISKIVFYLNSPGGEAFQGMSIVDEMRLFQSQGIDIRVEGRGLIASAAVPIFLEANYRIASKYTVFMMHPAALFKWGMFSEGLSDLEAQANMIKLLNNHYAASVAENSKISKEKVLELMKETNWFTADQAKEMGFVDEVI